jgi:hypothetical protein
MLLVIRDQFRECHATSDAATAPRPGNRIESWAESSGEVVDQHGDRLPDDVAGPAPGVSSATFSKWKAKYGGLQVRDGIPGRVASQGT